MFLQTIIREHDFISNFVVMVCFLTIFADVVFIRLCLLFSDVLIPNPPYVLSGELYHSQLIIGLDYNLLIYLL